VEVFVGGVRLSVSPDIQTNYTLHELVQNALKLIYGNAEFQKFSSLFYIQFYIAVSFSCLS
jgi:hypothetical protein